MPDIFFEDLVPGDVVFYGDRIIEKDEIVAFARDFDPQPFHLSEEGGRASMAGGLIASGWHTAALMHRMSCDHFLNRSSCMGSPGVDEMRWLKPVRPGDRLRVRREILGNRPWRGKPDRGVVHVRFDLINQDDAVVTAYDCRILFARRAAAVADEPEPATGAMPPATDPSHPKEDAGRPRLDLLPYFDDVPLGHVMELGDYAFTAENIRDFALAFDNQPFHVDEEAARRSHFGGVIASGFHTASGWMARMVRSRAGRAEALAATGAPVARLGVSPGFRNMRWLKPVRPGDVIAYRSRTTEKRPSASRPDFGLLFQHNTGDNQHGERVFEFSGCVFLERRRP